MSGYFYTIPAPIFYDKNLSDQAKLVAGLIANFCNKYGVCTVTNRNLGEVIGKSERTLSRIISELQEYGYIDVKVDFLDNNKRFITLTTKMSTPHDKSDVPTRQKWRDNNIKENNTINNNVELIIEYLNEVTNSKYRPGNKNTQGLVNGRIAEGYTVDDFKKVIDTMKKRWEGTEYEQYLTPNTLFRPSNFEKYLNFANKEQPQKQPIKIKAQ